MPTRPPDATPPFSVPILRGLLDLLFELRGAGPPPTVGGGFGLYLKRWHQEQGGERTRIEPARWPAARSTTDLDLVLRAEFLADAARVRLLADVLGRLGYTPVKGAEYMQFVRTLPDDDGNPREVKIDLLVGPFGPFKDRLKTSKPPRVRPKAVKKGRLHAHNTPEAVGVEDEPLSIPIEGRRSTGEECQAQVCLPQAFPYAMMKLFAFRDRKDDPDPRKDKGRHHALDLYAIVAMMTEPEYDFARRARSKYAGNDKVREAAGIVRQNFAGPESMGVLRLREHALFNAAMDLKTFLSVLQEIFT